METLMQFAQMLGLEPILTPVAGALGFFLVFARASVKWFNASHTLGASMALGLGLTALKFAMPEHSQQLGQVGWAGVVLHGFVTGLVALGGSYGLPIAFEKLGIKILAPANNSRVTGEEA